MIFSIRCELWYFEIENINKYLIPVYSKLKKTFLVQILQKIFALLHYQTSIKKSGMAMSFLLPNQNIILRLI